MDDEICFVNISIFIDIKRNMSLVVHSMRIRYVKSNSDHFIYFQIISYKSYIEIKTLTIKDDSVIVNFRFMSILRLEKNVLCKT